MKEIDEAHVLRENCCFSIWFLGSEPLPVFSTLAMSQGKCVYYKFTEHFESNIEVTNIIFIELLNLHNLRICKYFLSRFESIHIYVCIVYILKYIFIIQIFLIYSNILIIMLIIFFLKHIFIYIYFFLTPGT